MVIPTEVPVLQTVVKVYNLMGLLFLKPGQVPFSPSPHPFPVFSLPSPAVSVRITQPSRNERLQKTVSKWLCWTSNNVGQGCDSQQVAEGQID